MINVKGRNIILGSASPRRAELMRSLNIPFVVKVSNFDEKTLVNISDPVSMARSIAEGKNKSLRDSCNQNDIVITADTVVYIDKMVFCKPDDEVHAKQMLKQLSGKYHNVVTAVCIADYKKIYSFESITRVKFAELVDEDIDYYITKYKPLDKAGAYGIQEWIGAIGIEKIDGDFYTVVGMPMQLLYEHLKTFIYYE